MGTFLRHSSCPHCGSRDAYAVYSGGDAFCFSCHERDAIAYGGDGTGGYKRMTGELIPGAELEVKPLPARKLLKNTCAAYDYSVAKYKNEWVHVAPYYHRGKLAGQHLRTAAKDFKWLGSSKNLELFGQRIWPSGSNQRIVVTEGEIDAMSIAQVFGLKLPVVSIPSGVGSAKKAIAENLEYLSGFPQVILAFDNDKPGQDALNEVVHLFPPGQVGLFTYPEGIKDANELLMAGEGQRIIDGVMRCRPYRPDGIISGIDLWNDITSPDESGFDTLYPGLTSYFKGLRKGELYLFTAGSGVGKTTFVREISYDFLTRHKLKIGVLALEESKKRVGRAYCGIHLNKPITISRAGVTTAQLEEAFKATVGSGRFWMYDHWGSTDLDGLLGKLRWLAVGAGVDWIVLDHISIVVSGLDEVAESERKLIDKLMTRNRSLIEETGVGMLAIVHLKRPESGKESWNEGKQIRLTDLRGSGGLEQLSDGVIAQERDQQGDHADTSFVRVLKNRPIGKTGLCDTLVYNHETGRLLPEVAMSFGMKGDF
jgi:twinkle protein